MKRNIFTITTAIAMLMTASALANDHKIGIVSKSPSADYTPVEFGSGWYIRGDIGFAVTGDADVSFSRTTAGGDVDASTGNDFSVGVGFGYIFNPNFRVDATFDTILNGDWSGSGSGCGAGNTGSCTSSDSGSFESNSASINAYFNLGSFGRFNPYVGAGIGLADITLSDGTSRLSCELDPGETCALGVHSGGLGTETFAATRTHTSPVETVNLVYSLTAGVDYRIDKNWTADISYRYTDITANEFFGAGAAGETASFDGIELHEVRAGLRYELF